MTIWIIEPHDPLIFRDGRPFGATPGARAKSLPFPFPSTIAGGVRARAGLRDGIFQVQSEKLEDLKKLKVQGPLLVQLPRSGYAITPANLLVPAPGDAVLFEEEKEEEKEEEQRKQLPEEVQKQLTIEKLKQNLPEAILASEKIQDELNDIVEYKLAVGVVKQLLPVKLTGAEYSAFRVEEDKDGRQSKLMLVGLEEVDASKPLKEAPHYWYWDHFVAWLLAPEHYHQKVLPLHLLGHSGPKYELRVHVSIDANTRTGEDGALFDTSGLEFTYRGKLPETSLAQAERLALAVNIEENQDFRLEAGPGNLGGERRLVGWHKSESSLFPNCPEELEEAIIGSGYCRLLLLTPAYFDKGYQPDWLQKKRCGVEVEIQASLVQRAQVVSGWDMAVSTKGAPGGERKATRRLVPAGSVYYLALKGSADDIRTWIRETWMQCVSDGDAEKLDGFGLAVLGTWSGTAVEMKVSEKEKRS